MGYILAVIRSLVIGMTTIFNKNYMTNTKDVKLGLDIFMIISYPIALMFYFVLSGCRIGANMPTLIFAFVYAFISIASNIVSLVGLNYATIVYMNIFSAAGSTVILFLYELLFTEDMFSTWRIMSVFMAIFAVCIPLIFNRGNGSMSKKGFVMCLAYLLISGTAGIVSRMYVSRSDVMSTSVFCFWTNVVIMPIIFTNILRKSSVKALAADARLVGVKNSLYVVGNAIFGNMMTIVSLEIVRLLGGTVSSILSGTLNMMSTSLVSVLVYRERVTHQTLFSIIFSIAAVVMGVF